MTKTTIDLKELERQAFRSTFQDGLWDIYLGLMLLPMTVWFVMVVPNDFPDALSLSVMMILLLLPYILFRSSKKYFVIPRLGLVKFREGRQKKRKKLGLALSLSVMGTVILVIMTARAVIPTVGSLPLWAVPIGLFGVKIIIVFSLLAYYLDFSRAYLYGWFYALAILDLMRSMGAEAAFLVLAPLFATIMIAVGSVLFIRFLRGHPPVERNMKLS